MSFFTTSIKPSSEDIPGVIFVSEVLSKEASYISEEINKRFNKYDITPYLLNSQKDLYIGQNHLINFLKLEDLQPIKEVTSFIDSFCKISCSTILGTHLQFPNAYYRTSIIVPFQEGDEFNKQMIIVKSKNIIEGEEMSIHIRYRPDIEIIHIFDKLQDIISNWFIEGKNKGFYGEFLKEGKSGFVIRNSKNDIYFNLGYTGLIRFPFWELYCRLRSSLDISERPSAIIFK